MPGDLIIPSEPSDEELGNVLQEFFRRNIENRKPIIPQPFLVQTDEQHFDTETKVVRQIDNYQTPKPQTVFAPAPIITSFDPTSGPVTGGTQFQVDGDNFIDSTHQNHAKLYFVFIHDNVAFEATGTFETESHFFGYTPATTRNGITYTGPATIRIANPDGQYVDSTDFFTFNVGAPSAFTLSGLPAYLFLDRIYHVTLSTVTSFSGPVILLDRPPPSLATVYAFGGGVVCAGPVTGHWPSPINIVNGIAHFDVYFLACANPDYNNGGFAQGIVYVSVRNPDGSGSQTLNGFPQLNVAFQ